MSNRYYDNTRVSGFRECPRAFYFRHVRHWRRDGKMPPALVFGLSWHEAMDIVWGHAKDLDDATLHAAAMAAFEKEWVSHDYPALDEITPDEMSDLGARTPGTAAEMLYNYIKERAPFLRQNQVIACERPFAVPLDPTDEGLWYVGRLDKQLLLLKEDRIIVGEHKTTSLYSVGAGIQPRQLQEYSPNSQVDGYQHANRMLNGAKAKSVWVDLALVHKTVHNVFRWVAVDRAVDQLSAWLWETRTVIAAIEENLKTLFNLRTTGQADAQPFLPAFPKNTNSCSGKYARCTYDELCKYVANPEQRWPDADDVPEGFIIDKWAPFDVLELDKIGMPEEG